MRPKVCVFSVGLLSEAVMTQIQQMQLPVDFIFHENGWQLQEKLILPPSLDNVVVFLSSGYRAKSIAQQTNKPVINMEISSYDILLALSKAIQHDEKPVIITYKNDYAKLNQIRNIISVFPIQDSYSELEDLEELILKYKRQGCKSIIGSGLACSLAKKHGLMYTFVYPQDSIRNFLQIASDLAISIDREIKRNKQMSSVINYANRGIVFTNSQGIISVCNPVAETIFRVDEHQALGRQICDFFVNNELNDILQIKEIEINILATINGKEYVLSAIPITYNDELVNMLFFIDDVGSIQKADRYIRANLTSKGFTADYHFHEYTSRNTQFLKQMETAKRYSKTDESIVIYGETGTGKEVLAQSIHNNSRRSKNAFIAVNCSAISGNLLESELFGYDEGAFTGAKKGGKKGLFEMAHLGTMFLDEIGDMDLSLQSKLLRVVQEQEVMHVGGTKVIQFDTRIIAATNHNLWELVKQKKFRQDLYYRLNVLELTLLPLRDRKEDIYPLFNNFVLEIAPQIVALLNPHASYIEQLLISYTWPGNVRELKNFAKMLVSSLDSNCNAKEILNLMHEILDTKSKNHNIVPNQEKINSKKMEILSFQRAEAEIQKITDALEETKGNRTKAAELLGISRVTLWRKISKIQEGIKIDNKQ